MNRSDKKIQRRLEVLRELVGTYIETCSPVSSEQICMNIKNTISSATVRNTLAELDELGWTHQPHLSSGRIPSWKGYRAYVDILKPSDLSSRDHIPALTKGIAGFRMSSADIGPGLQKMAGTLSELSGCCGVVLSPQFENDFIRQIRLVPVDTSRVLVVLISDFGLIKTETVQVHHKLGYFSQKRIENYLNYRLHGHSDSDSPSTSPYDDDEKEFGDEVYNEIVLKYLINLRPRGGNEVFLEGLGRVFDNPELQAPKAVQSVIEFFEDRDGIVEQLREALKVKNVFVRLGEDINAVRNDISFSLIAAPYKLNSINVGVVGVIGLVRMPYRKLIPLVRQSADFLSERLAENFRKPRLSFDRDIPFKIVQ